MREVRIRDTLSGEPRTLDPAGEVGIYACGPTVYSRIHIGNARPFVVFSLFARFLRSEGYAARLVVNVTDVNDKIYAAAGEAGEPSAEFADADDPRLLRGHRPARARPPRRRAAGDRDDRRDRRADRRPGRGAATPTSPAATSTSGSAASAATASSPTAAPRTWTRARRRARPRSRRTRSTSPSGRRTRRARTPAGTRPGARAGPAGTSSARRWPRRAGRLLRDPRRRLRPRLPPPRERDRPVRGGGAAVRPDLDAQRDDRDRRREDVEIRGQHLPAVRGARSVWARGGRRLPDLRALPAAAGVRAGADGAGRGQVERLRNFFREHPGRRAGSLGEGSPSNSGEVPASPPRAPSRGRCVPRRAGR